MVPKRLQEADFQYFSIAWIYNRVCMFQVCKDLQQGLYVPGLRCLGAGSMHFYVGPYRVGADSDSGPDSHSSRITCMQNVFIFMEQLTD